jgi:diaminohydroxyphosphoribosylaminopyrimidine deaminase/5-amino-6-(5-phosphoribosylamino)uracil reductase
MHRALQLAGLGTGRVSPNPRVGCVIVHEERIIGEGWHQRWGEAHAEVNAIDSVVDKSLLKDSTVYVNLEPCSHTGKTPPCADLLIRSSVRKVVVANVDSNPLVEGEGIKKLMAAGIEVAIGVLEKEGREVNKRYFTFIEKNRPYIILKWAQTADGFLAHKNFDSQWISNEFSRQVVHRWRSEEDAVLVGMKTAALDRPQLNVREWSGRNPVRIVIDRFLRLPENLPLWEGPQQTICYNVLKQEERGSVRFIRLEEEDFITQLIDDLYKQKLQSVIIEGGPLTLQLFISLGYWDEARIFYAPSLFGQGIEAPIVLGNLVSTEHIFSDELKIWTNPIAATALSHESR